MKIALLGYGKMGKTLHQLITDHPDHRTVLLIHSANTSELTIERLNQADVAIEFSTPETAVDNIYQCFEANVPVVIGTTGWLDQMEQVKADCLQRNQSMLYAANFSLGVNLFFKLNKMLSQIMAKHKDYSVSIQETHHITKKDAPSGTAIHLAKDIISNSAYESWTAKAKESEDQIQVQSFRKEDVKGDHTISWSGTNDAIHISHRADNRLGFASGALKAAEWLKGKQGFYTMEDVLEGI